MTEIWKDIEGYEGLYQVSNMGRVKSLPRRTTRGGILKTNSSARYLQVDLSKNGESILHSIHRLVATAFPDICGVYFDGAEVNHKDENTHNNKAENLEWCTKHYNNNYGTRVERIVKKTSKPVNQYTKDGRLIAEYSSASEAERQTGIHQGNICSCCRGNKSFSHAGGYKWAYK